MTAKIQVLTEQIINQIAAGEVIENPASVVKELVENAIDAKATKIIVEIQGGGLHLIRVSDNGSGMGREDALLCLQRHATSKIRSEKDLWGISTMGFRGEALASIASIAKMDLITSLTDTGTKVEVSAGTITAVELAARSQGTTVEVRHLFTNVPARKKFQKSPAQCSADITKALTILSLASPHVAFVLYQQDKCIFETTNSKKSSFYPSLKERIDQVLGAAVWHDALPVQVESDSFTFQGYIGSPENTRPNRYSQYLFVNARPVTSSALSHAIKDGYGTRIGADRHPLFVLHVQVPPSLIDVNVHPQKKEIRFRDEALIKSKLKQAIIDSLSAHSHPFVQDTSSMFSSFSSFQQERESAPAVFDFSSSIETVEKILKEEERALPLIHCPFVGVFSHFLLLDGSCLPEEEWCREEDASTGKLIFVNLLAAKSRVLFDRLISVDQEAIPQQGLLFPVTVEYSLAEAHVLSSYMETLHKMGFAIHPIGKSSFIVEAIPPFSHEDDVKTYLDEVLQSGAENEERGESSEVARIRKLASLLVKQVKQEKKNYAKEEALLLFKELMRTKSPHICPLGTKIIAAKGIDEIETFFISRKK